MIAAATLGLVLGVVAPTPARAQVPEQSVSFTPATVPVHGTIQITATCPSFGPTASAAISISPTGQGASVEAYGYAVLDGPTFVVDLPLRNGAPGEFDVVLRCSSLDAPASTEVRAPGLVLTEPSLPRAPMPTIESPYRIAHGDLLPVTGTCPATDPPADRVLFRKGVRSGDGVRAPVFEYADIDSSGLIDIGLEPPYPDNRAEHTLSMWCLAGNRYLGRGSGERTYRVLPAEPTTTTSASTSTSPSTVTTTAPPDAATGAVPVAGSPAYTG